MTATNVNGGRATKTTPRATSPIATGPGAGSPATLRLPLPNRQRRPGYVALAVLLIVGLAAVGGYLYLQAGKKSPVVVVIAEVAAGHEIQRSDLSTVDVAGAVTAIAGDHLASAVGQTATVTLLPGMLLQRSMITPASALGSDQAEVGIAAPSGSLPAEGLAPGDTVTVIGLPDRSGGSTSSAIGQPEVLAERASVFACIANPAEPGGFLVTLIVTRPQAMSIVAANAANRVALVVVS